MKKALLGSTLFFHLIFLAFELNAQVLEFSLGADTLLCAGDTIDLNIPFSGDTISYEWNTGDTTQSIAILQSDTVIGTVKSPCCEFSDTIIISFFPNPNIRFVSDPVCFDDTTNFIFTEALDSGSFITWSIPELGILNDTESFKLRLPDNGKSYMVNLSVQNIHGCLRDTNFEVTSLLKPTLGINSSPNCFLDSSFFFNQSMDVSQNGRLRLMTTGIDTVYPADRQKLSVFFNAPGLYNCFFVLDNQNGCSDTTTINQLVHPLPSLQLTGLDKTYCQNDGVDTIYANVPGGSFNASIAQILQDNSSLDSFAILTPSIPGKNINVTYNYTDQNGCSNSQLYIIDEIFPLPQPVLLGIDSVYCEGDGVDSIFGNFSGGIITGSNITQVSGSNSDLGIFDPASIGTNQLNYFFRDNNSCAADTNYNIEVFPLPTSLLTDTSIFSGDTIILLAGNDPNYSYIWSTGETDNQIQIWNPGFYTVDITDKSTGCAISDTIFVRFKTSTLDISATQLRVYPNPFDQFFDLVYDGTIQQLELYDMHGRKLQFSRQVVGQRIRIYLSEEHYGPIVVKVNDGLSRIIFKLTD